MQLGLDSVTTPTTGEAQSAARGGIHWWAGYVGGSAAAGVWDPSGWKALHTAGVAGLPIWIPSQNFSEDPVQQARLAMAACQRVGVTGVVGTAIHPSGRIQPNSTTRRPGPGSA